MKVAIILHEGTERAESLGRAVHALLYAQEVHEAGGQVQVVLDGAGTLWVARFADPEFPYAALYRQVRDAGLIAGVCDYCAGAFGVTAQVQASGLPLVKEYQGHPSLVGLIREGYQVVVL
ncbi:MAG TPA: hypothetical protein DC005_05580 [Proteobacteria bacterium]|nr:MAG: hypothetical protein COS73_06395 [Nitrospirae bacterium CG06_land_8_20_14_3_00_70_43]HBB40898.1 hypothetical protein [Pseudomonadota bacterium]